MQGNGDGTFTGVPGFTNDNIFETIVASDYNGDQKLDIATPFGIQYGRGDGTFNTVVPYPAGNGDDLVIAGDFNGDGFVDLALSKLGARSVGPARRHYDAHQSAQQRGFALQPAFPSGRVSTTSSH